MAWKLLFGSDIGLLSLGTIGFVIVMAIFFMVYFSKQVGDHTKEAK